MNLDDDLRSTLRSRAKRVIRLAHPHLNVGKFFVAGSSIATREISDIDVYPVGDEPFTIPDGKALAATKNAVTIANDPPIQFCRYKRATLEALIESFDFAHVRPGPRSRTARLFVPHGPMRSLRRMRAERVSSPAVSTRSPLRSES
mgnify:CR=1 FL=1